MAYWTCFADKEVSALNTSSDWEKWSEAFAAVEVSARSLGLNEEAVLYLGSLLAKDHDLPIEILYWTEADNKCPTRSTGYGNYYFHEAGNAWFDDNLRTHEYQDNNTDEWVKNDYIEIRIVLRDGPRYALTVADDFLSDRGKRMSQSDARAIVRQALEQDMPAAEKVKLTEPQNVMLHRVVETLQGMGLGNPLVITAVKRAIAILPEQQVSAYITDDTTQSQIKADMMQVKVGAQWTPLSSYKYEEQEFWGTSYLHHKRRNYRVPVEGTEVVICVDSPVHCDLCKQDIEDGDEHARQVHGDEAILR